MVFVAARVPKRSVLAKTAGVDQRRGVAVTARFLRETHFLKKERGFLRVRRERTKE